MSMCGLVLLCAENINAELKMPICVWEIEEIVRLYRQL